MYQIVVTKSCIFRINKLILTLNRQHYFNHNYPQISEAQFHNTIILCKIYIILLYSIYSAKK